ncbi:DUF2157 domain-containing protein [Psychrobacter sp. Sarcosine-3u-12]|uniref:DUF2157 domain-containing protein n=1 Tax=Psychrobacter sp. Sarcosine-3u-12 TaxID=2058325 RepID=UPI000C320B53|nr:DUF2157 domain-containing protein [Psychrobacter sp. Sarcosine-3u-12]PKG35083.1 hypothetical protein CXF65_09810 [Psychrobacter sp. Sarcosine-3u-12]
MTQSRRTIEQLLSQGTLPIEKADTAALFLDVYPSKRTWLQFFDKALLIIGAVALVLSLVLFIAYNWLYMGKLAKFALVEGALVITIALYVALSFRRRFAFVRQLLLLIASIITGSLLALFGQVYQTGADTWQLFFGWAILITPWVLIARFPALWLLWLGLINAFLLLYLGIIDLSLINDSYQNIIRAATLALFNLIALNFWLIFLDQQRTPSQSFNPDTSISNPNLSNYQTSTNDIVLQTQSSLHWSSYIVGLVSTVFITFLAIITVFEVDSVIATLLSLLLWVGWCAFIYWRFYQRDRNLLMLTYLCFSIIIVVMFWASKVLPSNFDAGTLLLLTFLLIGMITYAIKWLFNVAKLDNNPFEGFRVSTVVDTPLNKEGVDHE